MNDDEYIEYLEGNYGESRGAQPVTWKPARDSNYLYDSGFDDQQENNMSHSGQVLATFERRPRGMRIRPDLAMTRGNQISDFWDIDGDQPRYSKYTWGPICYQLPIVPPQDADTEKKQIVLQHTISSLRQASGTTYFDKYNALTNRFPLGKDLVPHVNQRTTKFQDPASTAYEYSDVTILDGNMQATALSDPITDAERLAIRFVKATIHSVPRQVVAPNTIRNMPKQMTELNFIIRIPTDDNGNVINELADAQILKQPRNIMRTIVENDGTPHIGFKKGESINQDHFENWKTNVVATMNFAVMETLLYRDYVAQTSTTTPEHRLRQLSQYRTDTNGRINKLTVSQLYQKALHEIRLLDDTRTYTVNLPKIFFDALDDSIKRKLESKRMMPSDDIVPNNNVALTTLSNLNRVAQEIEADIKESRDLVQSELALLQPVARKQQHRTMNAKLLMSPIHRQRQDTRPSDDVNEEFLSYYTLNHSSSLPADTMSSYYEDENDEELKPAAVPKRTKYTTLLSRVEPDGMALLSLAEKALREASGMAKPLTCWGCGGEHLFNHCPHKNNPAVLKKYTEALKEWTSKGGPRHRLLTANKAMYEWQTLGFKSQKQAQKFVDIMKADQSPAARTTLIDELLAGKAMVTRATRAIEKTEETDEENHSPIRTRSRKRIALLAVPIKKYQPTIFPVLAATLKEPPTTSRFVISGELPHIALTIGEDDGDEGTIQLKGCLDSCAGGTIGYRPYHEKIMEEYPQVVYEFIDYKTRNIPPYLIGGIEEEGEGIEITAEIAYKTPYIKDGQYVDLIVGLSDAVSANTIFGIPLQDKAGFVINYEQKHVISSAFKETFPIFYQAPERRDELIPQGGLSFKTLTTKGIQSDHHNE
jgi:hypothetical protein